MLHGRSRRNMRATTSFGGNEVSVRYVGENAVVGGARLVMLTLRRQRTIQRQKRQTALLLSPLLCLLVLV